MPQKPGKYGFLFRSLNDSVHAYTYRSHIYAGRPEKEPTEHYISGKFFFNILVSVSDLYPHQNRRFSSCKEIELQILTNYNSYRHSGHCEAAGAAVRRTS